jgi:hypothetical protein
VNWRLVGCGVLAAAVFVGLGIWALTLAMGRVGCPTTLYWGDATYLATGEPTAMPDVGDEEAVRLGFTFVGVLTREVYGPEGTSPSAEPSERPDRLALDCGDGTFQTYVASDAPNSRTPAASAKRSVMPET